MKEKECTVDLKELVAIYTELQNLFEGLTPSRIKRILTGKTEADVLEFKRNCISERVVEIIENNLTKKTNLRIGASPFVVDSETILKGITKGDLL